MSKMNSYKKLYLTGFIFVGFITLCLVFSIYHATKFYDNKLKTKKLENKNVLYITDTIYIEKPVEKLKTDTVYIYPKPKVKVKTDSTTSSPSPFSIQSQD